MPTPSRKGESAMKRLFPEYPSDDYRDMYYDVKARADREWFDKGTGPRAKFEAEWKRGFEFRRMCEPGGSLADLSATFDAVEAAYYEAAA